jgi:Protein of unknown function (DUF416)
MVGSVMTQIFDERRLREELAVIDASRLVVFACACAQHLMPLYGRYALAAHADADGLARALAKIWETPIGTVSGVDLEIELATSLIPSEDKDWIFEVGYAQAAAAAVAYAGRTLRASDPHDAIWAARQVYEAADYGAQFLIEIPQARRLEREQAVLGASIVQQAIADVWIYLELARHDQNYAEIRNEAICRGESWARSLP